MSIHSLKGLNIVEPQIVVLDEQAIKAQANNIAKYIEESLSWLWHLIVRLMVGLNGLLLINYAQDIRYVTHKWIFSAKFSKMCVFCVLSLLWFGFVCSRASHHYHNLINVKHFKTLSPLKIHILFHVLLYMHRLVMTQCSIGKIRSLNSFFATHSNFFLEIYC